MKNPILRLLSKGLALAFLLFLSVYSGSYYAGLFFSGLLIYWYIRPPLDLGKFALETALLLISIFLFPHESDPNILFTFSLSVGVLLSLIISLKNILIIRRDAGRLILRFGTLAIYNYLYFYGNFGLFSAVILFAAAVILMHHFYLDYIGRDRSRLAGFLIGLILIQLNWILSLLPEDPFLRFVFSTTAFTLLGIGIMKNFNQTFDKRSLRQEAFLLGAALLLLLVF